MAHSFEELRKKTVAQLREIAEGLEHEAVQGYKTMHKKELIHALCQALGIEEHVHHEVVGIEKTAIKKKIRELKAKRDAAMEAKDYDQLKRARHNIRRLKRKIRRAWM